MEVTNYWWAGAIDTCDLGENHTLMGSDNYGCDSGPDRSIMACSLLPSPFNKEMYYIEH